MHAVTCLRTMLAGLMILAVACGDDDDTGATDESIRGSDSGMEEGGDGDMAVGDGDGDMAAGDGDGDATGGDGDMMGDPSDPEMAWNGVESDVDAGTILPIIFVHGYVGSAQQYQSQAQRWEMNGYPSELIRAYDHDGAGREIMAYADGTAELIDKTLEDFPEYDQVYLVGHSRGTATSGAYLTDEDRRAKVAKYIALDGAPCPATIACLAPTQANIPGQKHVEVATSAESFAMQYEFIMGEPPQQVDIEQQDGMVTLSGRSVNFPENTGTDGAVLSFYEIDPDTGERVTEEPHGSFEIDETGEWGPLEVDPEKLYEQYLYWEETDSHYHVYTQRHLRNSDLVRVLAGDPETSATRENTNGGEGHVAFIAVRMREWLSSDVLEITTTVEGEVMDTVNVIHDDLDDGAIQAIGLHVHDDAATPEETTLEPLPFFSDQPFQNGMDVYIPAADPPNGTVTLVNYPRGDMDKPQTLVFPNWASDEHLVQAYFNDYAQD